MVGHVKGIREVNNFFQNLVLFHRVLSKVQDAFYTFRKIKTLFEI